MKHKLLLSVIGILVAAFIAEIYLRNFYPQITYYKADLFSFRCFKEGSEDWIELTPNKTCVLKSEAGLFDDVEVRINSLGLRGREVKMKKPENTKRILFIGDSFIMGWGVKEENTVSEQTAQILNSMNLKTASESLNAGVAARGVSDYYLVLKNTGMELDPDIVVTGFYLGNDVIQQDEFVYTKADSSGLPLSSRSRASFVDISGQIRLRKIPYQYSIPYLRESQLFIFFASRLLNTSSIYTTRDSVPLQVCQFKEWCKDLNREKAEVKKLFIAMKKITDNRKTKFLIALIPAKFQIYGGSEIEFNMPVLFPQEKDYPEREWSDFFSENNIDYIDLLPDFLDKKDIQTYYHLDEHWNNTGHHIAAEAISKKLEKYLSE